MINALKNIFVKKNYAKEINNQIILNIEDFENYSQSVLFSKIVDEVYNRDINLSRMCDFDTPLKNLIYVFNMHYQVINGGVIRFIDNSTGKYFEETLQALKEINVYIYSEILEKVREKYPNKIIPKHWKKRRNALDKMSKNLTQKQEWELEDYFEKLDRQYYENESQFELIIIEYVKTLFINNKQ